MELKSGDKFIGNQEEMMSGSQVIETGFGGETIDSSPIPLFNGKDIMSIVMKRRLGGSSKSEKSMEPLVKKARKEHSVIEGEDGECKRVENNTYTDLKENIAEAETEKRLFRCETGICNMEAIKENESTECVNRDNNSEVRKFNNVYSERNSGPAEEDYTQQKSENRACGKKIEIDLLSKMGETNSHMSQQGTNIEVFTDSDSSLDFATFVLEPNIKQDDAPLSSDRALKDGHSSVNAIADERSASVLQYPLETSDQDMKNELLNCYDKSKSQPNKKCDFIKAESHIGSRREVNLLKSSSESNDNLSGEENGPGSLKSVDVGEMNSFKIESDNIQEKKQRSENKTVNKRAKLKADSNDALTDEESSFGVDGPSDLDVLAAAAEERQRILGISPAHYTHPSKTESTSSNALKLKDRKQDKRKSRKQVTPRRVSQPVMNVDETSLGQVGLSDASEDKQGWEKSRKQKRPHRVMNELNGDEKEKSDKIDLVIKKEDTENSETADSEEETYYSTNPRDSNKFKVTDNLQNDTPDMDNFYGNLSNCYMPYFQGRNIREPTFPVSPFQNEMLATLAQSFYPSATAGDDASRVITPDVQSGSCNIDDNLQVVRRLREIRFYKYRKISLSEKQEIAIYAKLHGVSAAAGHFGVSKSAVSMWTRTDFRCLKDDGGKKKRNCMIGNEKFEQLVDRVKQEKTNKFKGLTKQDKFEVSRYAKLVGVREMARCLGIALGTVSGWMRQFPYTLKPGNQEEELSNLSGDVTDESTIDHVDTSETNSRANNDDKTSGNLQEQEKAFKRFGSPFQTENSEEMSCSSEVKEAIRGTAVERHTNRSFGSVDADSLTEDSMDVGEFTSKKYNKDDGSNESVNRLDHSRGKRSARTCLKEEKLSSDELDNSEHKDELDEMIAETLMKPDIDKCFADIKEQITGTSLENDEFFESLFRRVISCRIDKYKSLKASEKLEVVRYAKRIGVRKVAKLLGLATGTLSGWNTKYQAHLGLTMDGSLDSSGTVDVDNSVSSRKSFDSPGPSKESNGSISANDRCSPVVSSNSSQQSSSVLDNAEKSEVTAIKFLMKEQFPILLHKIEIARQIKFRNILPSEKIEIVKCAKLVGIRPTARVLNMPIGTLSGWITKYTDSLHPVYHIDNVEDTEFSSANFAEQAPGSDVVNDMTRNDIVTRNIHTFKSPVSSLTAISNVTMKESSIFDGSIGLHEYTPSFGAKFEAAAEGPEAEASGGKTTATPGTSNTHFDEESKRIAQQYIDMYSPTGLVNF